MSAHRYNGRLHTNTQTRDKHSWKKKDDFLELFIKSAVEALLWLEQLECKSADDIDVECMDWLRTECEEFTGLSKIDLIGMRPEQAGHDFTLTRNGHGAGFWDRGLGAVGERLTENAKSFGSTYIDVFSGKIFIG